MKNLKFLMILFSVVFIQCSENEPNDHSIHDMDWESTFKVQTSQGIVTFDLSNPTADFVKVINSGITIREIQTRNQVSCDAPCGDNSITRIFPFTLDNQCGSEGSCSGELWMDYCVVDVVANGTTEFYLFNADLRVDFGSCVGADEDCLLSILIPRFNSSIANVIYLFGNTSNDPLPCGVPTVNWSSTYSIVSCSSNCEVDCGDACCQYYTSFCLGDNGSTVIGDYIGSNQIRDCSGNSNLPEGCECFQTDCENQYDF